MDLSYGWLLTITAIMTIIGLLILLCWKAEFYAVRAAYWLVIIGSVVLAAVLIGGLVQHILLQLK